MGAFGGILGSTYALIHDLGRPERFYMMLRVAKVTSPMSMGTWLISAYGPAAGLRLLVKWPICCRSRPP